MFVVPSESASNWNLNIILGAFGLYGGGGGVGYVKRWERGDEVLASRKVNDNNIKGVNFFTLHRS